MSLRSLIRQARWAAIRTRGFKEGEWGPSTPTEVYNKLIESGNIIEDSKQRQLLNLLQQMYDGVVWNKNNKDESSTLWKMFKNTVETIKERNKSTTTIVNSDTNINKGLYIHGDVGCGKTMLMDIFFRCIPTKRKLRIHLQAFLLDTYKTVHRITNEYMQLTADKKEESDDIMDIYVSEITSNYDLICFDEFQVLDPGDAALLANLFQKLFSHDILVIFTSNKSPTFYLSLGRQYNSFVKQLHSHCNTHSLRSTYEGGDYRKATGTQTSKTYLYPNTQNNTRMLLQLFKDVVKSEIESGSFLESVGRSIPIPRRAGGVALFTFADLCGNDIPKSPSDYQLIVEQFHTIFIVGIPVLSMFRRNEARRFINLIDEMYQYKVKLICTAEADLKNLFAYETLSDAALRQSSHSADSDDSSFDSRTLWRFSGEEDVFAFKRVESRLAEMSTHEYLLLPHLNYVIDDIYIEMLFTKEFDVSKEKSFIDI